MVGWHHRLDGHEFWASFGSWWWTGVLQFMGSQKVGHDWATELNSCIFSKSSLYIWKFLVHVLLKPSLKGFEHYFASMWNKRNCVVVCTFFGIALPWDWNENHWGLLLKINGMCCNHFHISPKTQHICCYLTDSYSRKGCRGVFEIMIFDLVNQALCHSLSRKSSKQKFHVFSQKHLQSMSLAKSWSFEEIYEKEILEHDSHYTWICPMVFPSCPQVYCP